VEIVLYTVYGLHNSVPISKVKESESEIDLEFAKRYARVSLIVVTGYIDLVPGSEIYCFVLVVQVFDLGD